MGNPLLFVSNRFSPVFLPDKASKGSGRSARIRPLDRSSHIDFWEEDILEEGWYLMSITDLEIELARLRGEDRPPSNAVALETAEALVYRNRGNLPDDADRSLRLVLRVEDEVDLGSLEAKRLRFEPDFYKAPSWRREGSKPVNVVPLRALEVGNPDRGPWWDDPEMASMEAEWVKSGSVAGLVIPGSYRSFVYKTIAFLRSRGMAISVDSVSDSVARWMSRTDADSLRAALADANREQ